MIIHLSYLGTEGPHVCWGPDNNNLADPAVPFDSIINEVVCFMAIVSIVPHINRLQDILSYYKLARELEN